MPYMLYAEKTSVNIKEKIIDKFIKNLIKCSEILISHQKNPHSMYDHDTRHTCTQIF